MTVFVAHRGLSALAPENTMAAFDLAWAHHCEGIELDVQVSKDGQVLVHHDPDLQRSAGVAKAIADCDAADVCSYDVGSHFDARFAAQRVPYLSDVLAAMPAGGLIQVEIKPEVSCLPPVIDALRNARRDIRLYVMSFDAAQLRSVRAALPDVDVLWLLDAKDAVEIETICQQAKQEGFTGLDVQHSVVDAAYVECVHAHDLLLGCWTVNNVLRMRTLAGFGIDMIASDCAHLAKEIVKKES